MAKDSFDEVLEQVPEEQRRLLERMMELKLITSFAWKDSDGGWVVAFTREGRDFLDVVKRVVSPDRRLRRASLLALDMLSDGQVVIGGFRRE